MLAESGRRMNKDEHRGELIMTTIIIIIIIIIINGVVF